MRRILPTLGMVLASSFALFGMTGCEDSESKSSEAKTSAQSPYLGAITGQLEAKPGAPADTIANATVFLEGHPEVKATTDEKGNFSLPNAPAGSHNVYAVSSAISLGGGRVRPKSRSGLSVSGTGYGLKITGVSVSTGSSTALGKRQLKETGAITGNVAFYTNPNSLDLTGSEVYIPGTSFIAKTDAAGAFSLTGIPVGDYSLRFEHTGFSVTQLEGISVAEGATTALGNVPLSLSTGPEGSVSLVADVTPTIGSDPVKVSTDLVVTLTLSYDADAALMKISDESSFLNKSWEPVAATKTWTFTSDGEKTLYVMYSDLNGLESSPYSDSIVVDTQAPTVSSLKLVHGWSAVASTSAFGDIVAADSGTGVAEVYFAGAGFGGAPGWVAYDSQLSVMLTGGVGAKTVTVKVRDYVGRESTGTVQDGINLSTKTTIFNGTYASKVTLGSSLSPFWVPDGVTFDGELEIEAGTTIEIADAKTFEAKGKVTAQGTSGSPIVFKQAVSGASMCTTGDSPVVKFNSGAPGVSEDSVLAYVNFEEMADVYLNGGSVTNASFDNSGCTALNGGITKTGEDNLTVDQSVFSNYEVAIDVQDGVGNTTFTNNSGDAAIFFKQSGNATASTVTGNTFTLNGSSSARAFVVSSGTLNAGSTNSFTVGTAMFYTVLEVSGDGDLTVSDLSLTGSNNIITASDDAVVTVSDSVFPGTGGMTSFLSVIEQSAVTLTNVSGSDWGYLVTGSGTPSVTIADSTFANVSGLALNLQSTLANAYTISNTAFTCTAMGDFASIGGNNSTMLSMYDVTVSGCGYGFKLGGGYTAGIDLDHVEISLRSNLFWSEATSGLTAQVSNSQITLANVSQPIDLFFNEPATTDSDSISITGSDIACVGDATTGCRGFTVYQNPMSVVNATIALTLSGNYWGGGKAPIASMYTGRVEASSATVNTTSDATNVKIFHFYAGVATDVQTVSSVVEDYTTSPVGSAVSGAGDVGASTGYVP